MVKIRNGNLMRRDKSAPKLRPSPKQGKSNYRPVTFTNHLIQKKMTIRGRTKTS